MGSVSKIQNVSQYDPGDVSTAQLRADWKILFGWHSSQVAGKEIMDREKNVVSATAVFKLAKGIFRELVRRGGTHFTSPDKMDNRIGARFFTRILKDVVGGNALFLEPPHGELAHKKKKRLIVLKQRAGQHLHVPIYLESGDKCYGVIRLDAQKRISLAKFKQFENAHGISDQERRKLWPRATEFWAYKFQFVVRFTKPVGVRVQPGDRTFLSGQKVLMKGLSTEGLSNEELAADIATLHQFYLEASEEEKASIEEIFMVKSLALWHRKMEDPVSDELSYIRDEFFKTAYAPVYSDTPTEKRGTEITKQEILDRLQSFQIRKPLVSLVGGLAIHGKTQGDIDILIRGSRTMPPDIEIPIKFRIYRAFCDNPELARRLSFLPDKYAGPFTDSIPVLALTAERINLDNEIVSMSAELQKAAVRAKNPEAVQQAEASKRENRLQIGRYFYPIRTAHSVSSDGGNEAYSLDQAINDVKKAWGRDGENFPVCVVESLME